MSFILNCTSAPTSDSDTFEYLSRSRSTCSGEGYAVRELRTIAPELRARSTFCRNPSSSVRSARIFLSPFSFASFLLASDVCAVVERSRSPASPASPVLGSLENEISLPEYVATTSSS